MVAAAYVPDQGHIITIDFDPQAGHKQAGRRPALVLSPAKYNKPAGLAIVVPITNQVKGYPFEVALPKGIKTTGVVLADAVKNADWVVRRARFVEEAPDQVLTDVQARLGTLLGFRV